MNKNHKLIRMIGDHGAEVRLLASLVSTMRPILMPTVTEAQMRQSDSASLSEGLEGGADPRAAMPQGEDFVFVPFRVLSAALTKPEMSGMVLDFTTPGVLEAAAPNLAGRALSKNHWDYDVESFYGVVSKSWWDAEGANTQGVPGINGELKVSKVLAPKLVYGLMMEPPAIDAVSQTLTIEFEYSHPKLVEDGLFWRRRMGEEIDGSLVRLIVTKIVKFGRLSFVTEGADVYNQRLPESENSNWGEPDDEYNPVEGFDEAEAGTKKKKTGAGMAASQPPEQATGEKTVKLSPEMIAALGLQGDSSTEFVESAVLGALPAVAAKAALGESLLTQLRDETKAVALRVAALNHKGEGEPALDVRDSLLIGKADAAELATLKEAYEKQVAASLSATCQSCGAKVTSLQSSVGGQMQPPPVAAPRVNVI